MKAISNAKENRCPNVAAQNTAIESMDVIDSRDLTDDSVPCTNDIETSTEEPMIDRGMKRVPLLFSGKYFQILNQENGFTKACCTVCENVYSARTNVTSNFVTHLKVFLIGFNLNINFHLQCVLCTY